MLIPLSDLLNRYNIKPKGVLHVGGHYAEEAADYAQHGMKPMIFIEGDPDSFKIMIERLKPFTNWIAVNQCISDVEEDAILNISSNEGQSSSILQFGTHTKAHPEVKFVGQKAVHTKRIDQIQFLDPSGWTIADCDFLNIDVQGYELKVLKSMGNLLQGFRYAYIEVNKAELYRGCPMIGEIDAYLAGFGFRQVEVKWAGNFGWGDAFFVKD
jgi:FkbM family methyltransferase